MILILRVSFEEGRINEKRAWMMLYITLEACFDK